MLTALILESKGKASSWLLQQGSSGSIEEIENDGVNLLQQTLFTYSHVYGFIFDWLKRYCSGEETWTGFYRGAWEAETPFMVSVSSAWEASEGPGAKVLFPACFVHWDNPWKPVFVIRTVPCPDGTGRLPVIGTRPTVATGTAHSSRCRYLSSLPISSSRNGAGRETDAESSIRRQDGSATASRAEARAGAVWTSQQHIFGLVLELGLRMVLVEELEAPEDGVLIQSANWNQHLLPSKSSSVVRVRPWNVLRGVNDLDAHLSALGAYGPGGFAPEGRNSTRCDSET
ncbi:hypothetical protein DFH09DRAFT_1113025 [Mycena vulgaris]|nr:hypothetical protein DFH09DRAFT_1113025 [Mycena vulgaris]